VVPDVALVLYGGAAADFVLRDASFEAGEVVVLDEVAVEPIGRLDSDAAARRVAELVTTLERRLERKESALPAELSLGAMVDVLYAAFGQVAVPDALVFGSFPLRSRHRQLAFS
jgi:hypothetical protein